MLKSISTRFAPRFRLSAVARVFSAIPVTLNEEVSRGRRERKTTAPGLLVTS